MWCTHQEVVPERRRLLTTHRVTTLFLEGEIGGRELETISEQLLAIAASGRPWVVLDLSDVSHLDYRVVRPLVARLELFRRAGGDMKLSGLSPYLRAILRASGGHDHFDLHPNAQEACAAFGRAPPDLM